MGFEPIAVRIDHEGRIVRVAPGAVLLGNHGYCFECGHPHGIGDRCVSLHMTPGYWEEIVASVPGARATTFAAPRLPSLVRVFRQVVGMTPHQYVLRTRMHCAAVRLRQSNEPISTIAFDAGLNDLSTFNRRFRRVMGASPSAYRAQRRAAP